MRKDDQVALDKRLSGQDTGKKHMEKGGNNEREESNKQDMKNEKNVKHGNQASMTSQNVAEPLKYIR